MKDHRHATRGRAYQRPVLRKHGRLAQVTRGEAVLVTDRRR